MTPKDYETRTKIIRESFYDHRTIKCELPLEKLNLDETTHKEGDFFLTEDGGIIDLELQHNDFTVEELVKYVQLAEDIYEKHNLPVSIYILCPKDVEVLVSEGEIYSDASFNIKLSKIENEICKSILNFIKEKAKKGKLNQEDIDMLKILPMHCRKEERSFYRIETMKLINEYCH